MWPAGSLSSPVLNPSSDGAAVVSDHILNIIKLIKVTHQGNEYPLILDN